MLTVSYGLSFSSVNVQQKNSMSIELVPLMLLINSVHAN